MGVVCTACQRLPCPMPDRPTPPTADDLLQRLSEELASQPSPAFKSSLSFLNDTGLAHWHVALGDSGWLARIPKQSQMRLAAHDNLRHQAACFARAAASGHTPQLHSTLPPSPRLPRGALIVQHVAGRAPRLPGDLPHIAQALAALHTLPLPPVPQRAPLTHDRDPLAALLQDIEQQWAEGQGGTAERSAPLHAVTRQAIGDGLAQLAALCAARPRPPTRLIAFDAHPGNFLIDTKHASPRAVLVDLEKCRYAYPGLDLAHATLYTSTTWDVASCAVLSPDQVSGFYRAWHEAVQGADADLADACAPWHLPLRRAMWLWSLTWCAKWLAHSQRPPTGTGDGEDWSADQNPAALTAHVRERVLHYLNPDTVRDVQAGFAALAQRGPQALT